LASQARATLLNAISLLHAKLQASIAQRHAVQAQFLIEGSNPAEEELLEMQSMGAVLDALGLCYVEDADDPRVWRMGKGSTKPQTAVQALRKVLDKAVVRMQNV
jgi:hypothetical protein